LVSKEYPALIFSFWHEVVAPAERLRTAFTAELEDQELKSDWMICSPKLRHARQMSLAK
jgi:hypothetical protein